jgi:methionyl-tRNA synthetase
VPGDPDQVIYVWFDALTNYLTSLDLGDGDGLLARYWHGGGERVHVIGKGITRFHAVYWPAFLLSAGLPLPDRIDVHGYLTQAQLKLSKSAGTAPDVDDVIEHHGVDAVRWYFVRGCRARTDTDVVLGEIDAAYDRDLADLLGNSLQRCVALAGRACGGRVPRPADDAGAHELRALATALPARVDAAVDAFALDEAAAAITAVLDAANRTLDRAAPWRRLADDPAAAATALYAPLESIRIAAGELEPFVPGVARTVAARLGGAQLAPAWGGLTPGAPLVAGPPAFPRRRRH